MKELIGKKINSIQIDENQETLFFNTDDGVIVYKTYGECCSDTWFADIIGVKALIGEIVNYVEDISMDFYNTDDGRCRQDYDEAYGVKLKTSKGTTDIIYRNSSNGYYGGDIYLMKDGSGIDFKKVDITDDWSA